MVSNGDRIMLVTWYAVQTGAMFTLVSETYATWCVQVADGMELSRNMSERCHVVCISVRMVADGVEW